MSARKKLSDLGLIVFQRVLTRDRAHEKLKVTFPHLVQFLALGSAGDCTRGSAGDCTGVVQGIAPKPLNLTLEEKPSPGATPADRASKGSASNGDDFERFYSAYPRKVAKARALEAWGHLSVAQRERAISAVHSFVAKCRRDGTEDRFIPHPATWLNDKRFDDFEATPDTPPIASAEYERNLARQFVRTEDWDRALGPLPGEPGSQVSAAVLAEVREALRKPSRSGCPTDMGGRIVKFEVTHAKARA